VFYARIRNGVKYRQWAADAQDFVAEENPDRRRPQTENLIHREIGIKRTAPRNSLPFGAVHPQILHRE
jgi:hypothetical protein